MPNLPGRVKQVISFPELRSWTATANTQLKTLDSNRHHFSCARRHHKLRVLIGGWWRKEKRPPPQHLFRPYEEIPLECRIFLEKCVPSFSPKPIDHHNLLLIFPASRQGASADKPLLRLPIFYPLLDSPDPSRPNQSWAWARCSL